MCIDIGLVVIQAQHKMDSSIFAPGCSGIKSSIQCYTVAANCDWHNTSTYIFDLEYTLPSRHSGRRHGTKTLEGAARMNNVGTSQGQRLMAVKGKLARRGIDILMHVHVVGIIHNGENRLVRGVCMVPC